MRVDANNIAGMQKDFDSFEIPPTQTATSYLTHLSDCAITGKFERLLADDAHERSEALGLNILDRLTDLLTLLMMRASTGDIIIGKYNDSPFYITHPDLHNRNIIIQGKPVVDDFSSASCRNSTKRQPQYRSEVTHSAKSRSSEDSSTEKLKLAGVVD